MELLRVGERERCRGPLEAECAGESLAYIGDGPLLRTRVKIVISKVVMVAGSNNFMYFQ